MVQRPVTACLITWKRQYNIPRIVEHLLKFDFISEILIHDNSKQENTMTYARHELAKKASNETIYVQDDDCINHDLEKLYQAYLASPEMVVHAGIDDYIKVIPENIYGNQQMALLGWGAFFPQSDNAVLDRYVERYGKDFCLLRESGRLFTMLLHRHHPVVPCTIENLRGDRDEHAMSSQEEHIKWKLEAIERAKTL